MQIYTVQIKTRRWCLRHCNRSCNSNIKIERLSQLYHNNTLPSFSPFPKLGQWMWHHLTERMVLVSFSLP